MLVTRTSKLERCARLAETRGRRLAVALLGSPAQADDLLQQALLVASRKAADVPAVMLWPWLARVITFEARNLRRREAGPSGASPLPPENQGPTAPTHDDPVEQVLRRELRERLAAAYDSLEPDQREALALVFGGEMSIRAAAKAAGVPRSTFQRRVDDGIAVLRSRLGVGRQSAVGLLGAHLNWLWQQAGPSGVGLTGATAGGTTSGSGATAASTLVATGVAIMSIKKAAALVTAAVLVALGAWWAWPSDDKQEADGGAARERITQPGPAVGGRNFPESAENPKDAGLDSTKPTRDVASPDSLTVKASEAPWESFALDLEGTVHGGGPLAGAQLTMIPVDPDFKEMPVTVSQEVGVSRASPLPRTDVPWPSNMRVSSFQAVSGEDGKFVLQFRGEWAPDRRSKSGIGVHMAWRLMVKAEGYETFVSAPGRLMYGLGDNVDKQTTWINLWEHGERTLSGRVLWMHDRSPIEGAEVRCVRLETSMSGDVQRLVRAIPHIKTGKDGSFRFFGVPGNESFTVMASPPGWDHREYIKADYSQSARHASFEYGLESSAVRASQLDIELPLFSKLYFRVMPEEAKPIEAWLLPGRRTETLPGVPVPAILGNDGEMLRYELPGLHSSHNTLILNAPGFDRKRIQISPEIGMNLDLGVVELDRGTTLSGVVKTLGGDPIPGASIWATAPTVTEPGRAMRSSYVPDVARTESASDGSYILSGLGEGRRYVWVTAQDFASQAFVIEFVSGEVQSKTIVMTSGGSVVGTVLHDGNLKASRSIPARGGTSNYYPLVRLIPEEHADPVQYSPLIDSDPDWSVLWQAGLEDGSNGHLTFRLDGIPPGRYMLRLSRTPRGSSNRGLPGVVVSEQQTTAVEIDARPDPNAPGAPPTGVIEGRVIGRDGKPAVGLWVAVFSSRSGTESRVDSDGNYRIPDVPIGTFNLVLMRGQPGWTGTSRMANSRRVTVVAGETIIENYDLSKDGGPEVRLTLLLDGKPQFDKVSIASRVNERYHRDEEKADENGEVLLYPLSAGDWTVTAETNIDGCRVVAATILKVPDVPTLTTTLNYRLAWVQGRVTGGSTVAGQLPLHQARVQAYPDGMQFVSWTVDDRGLPCQPDGSFRLPVVEGKVMVRAKLEGYDPAMTAIQAIGESRLELTLGEPTGDIHIRIASLDIDASNATLSRSWNTRLDPLKVNCPHQVTRYSGQSTPPTAGQTIEYKGVSAGEYVISVTTASLRLTSLTGANVRQEPDPDNPGESRWIITVLPGSETMLSVTLTGK